MELGDIYKILAALPYEKNPTNFIYCLVKDFAFFVCVCFFALSLFFLCLFIFGRETQSISGGGAERETDRQTDR